MHILALELLRLEKLKLLKMNFIMKPLTLIIAIAFLLNSCMSITELDVVKPADIDVPSEIVTFSIVKRNEAPKGKKIAKRWEGFVSGEGVGMDQRSVDFASTGLILELSKSPRFTIRQVVSSEVFYGTGTLNMAEPLSWEEVEKICSSNNSEALIVIEAFDSDIKRNVTSRDVTRNSTEGRVIKKVFDSNIRAKVFIGWRMYYPNEKRIIDVYNDDIYTKENSSWSSEEDASNDALRVESLVQKGAQDLGVRYARRISPTNVKLTRFFYGKGSKSIKRGKIKMLSKDYNEAIDIWEAEFDNAYKLKTKGRAAYNLAVVFEAKADYEMAIKWVKESIDVGNRKAKLYLAQLESRLNDEERLKKQMKK